MATNDGKQATGGMKKHSGGCHCGALRFEVELDLDAGGTRCNCSICTMVAQTSSIVKPSAFHLLSNEDSLATYAWGGKTGTRYFCKTCGIHAYGRGHLAELGGDYVTINLHCVDGVDPSQLKVMYWDGRHNNWHAGPRETPWPIA
jgi:hypothetical protein